MNSTLIARRRKISPGIRHKADLSSAVAISSFTGRPDAQLLLHLLVKSYEYSKILIDTIHEPMLILDKGLCVKAANRAFYEQFKLTPGNAEGLPLHKIGNGQWNIPALRRLLEEVALENSLAQNVEIAHWFSGETENTLSINASCAEEKPGGEQLILLAINDITELVRKRNETEHIRVMYQEELEKKSKALEEKSCELKKINKELESFSFISSHDLQEPLRKIKNFVRCLLDEERPHLSRTGRDYLQRMHETTNRMQKLINDLLAYSRVKDDKQGFEETDLNIILEKVREEYDEILRYKHIILKSGKLCKARIIPSQFQQLFSNLISNAIKFSSPERQSRIVLKSEVSAGSKLKNRLLLPNEQYCHITVSDNGIGFDPQYKDRIFEVFQRLHTHDEYKGSGIGLAICKKIVENHNGIITATGKVNKGARFDIYIPVEAGRCR